MDFSEKLKTMRKKFGLSQEELAGKLNVSRQAITKWETGGGLPDIENIVALANLFRITVDELLGTGAGLPQTTRFMFESVTEYDIDFVKHYDIHAGWAKEIRIVGTDREKLLVRLASNQISSLAADFKVKIDDLKHRLDVEIRQGKAVTKAQAKEDLYLLIQLPVKFMGDVELAACTGALSLEGFTVGKFEFDGKTGSVLLREVRGHYVFNCSMDMEIVCRNLPGQIDLNQITAASTLHLPEGSSYLAKTKGFGNRILYAVNRQPVPERAFGETENEAENLIILNGFNSELLINECGREEEE